MSSTRGGPKAGKPTIDCHRLPLDGRPFDPDAFLTKDRNANNQSKPSTQAGSKSTDRILTTPQLVSALTGIWNLVGQPESSCTAQRSESHGILHKDEPVFFSGEQKEQTVTSCCAENSTGLISQNFLSTPKSIFEDLSLVKKTLMLTSCSSMTGGSSVWRHMHVGSAYYIHQNIYPMQTRMMHTYAVSGSSELKENQCFRRDDNHSNQTRNMPTESCTSSSEVAHSYESSLHGTKSNVEKIPEYCSSSSCSSQQIVAGEEPRIIPADQISSNTCTLIENLCTSCLVDDAVVVNSDREDQNADGLMSQKHSVDNYSPQLEPNAQHQSYGAVTLNRHAVAGALAGTVVSVSLHPIDTVKTIIQVNSSGRSSFYHTLRHTLVERGVLGLYGGLGSKIACSAPISAIYTLTYEIVKGALLPILPKEYYSVAHCAAGGCSSIATSFVFTPSECIKQQMQVGSKYQNCWDALLGSLRRGGITSLYAGWGAVLCRNIPHSIVKFYTYENLKQFMLKSAPPNANLDSGQTHCAKITAKIIDVLHLSFFVEVLLGPLLRCLQLHSMLLKHEYSYRHSALLASIKVFFMHSKKFLSGKACRVFTGVWLQDWLCMYLKGLYFLHPMSSSKQLCFLNKNFLEVTFDHRVIGHGGGTGTLKYFLFNLMN